MGKSHAVGQAARPGYRVITYDRRRFGQSRQPKTAWHR